MKKTVFAAALLCLTAGFTAPVFAASPCEVVLCMYGKAVGNGGGGDCRSAEKAFFSITSFKKHHRFDPSKTADMRKVFLGDCGTADPIAIAKIIQAFGRLQG
ncbi:conjugal transfer protein [Serratia fonticola]|uniref:conjugal transfer protein n=1 Tax=Serratia fonticola TaxID=47917 RepID=UPI00301E0504